MDLEGIVSRANKLLTNMSHFSGPVDTINIIDRIYGPNQSWKNDSELIREIMVSLDLLSEAKYIHFPPAYGGNYYELTEAGRSAVIEDTQLTFSGSWLSGWFENLQLIEALREQRPTKENRVDQLSVRNWRQFSDVDIVFHPRLTILTGANGAGKTTLLNILAPHFNWSAQLLSRHSQQNPASGIDAQIGSLFYSNGIRSPLEHHAGAGVGSNPVSIPQIQQVPGLFVNSHRSISAYHPLTSLPARFSEWGVIQQQFTSELQMRYSGGASQYSPLYRMKEALVSAAMYAYGNKAVRENPDALELWEGYQAVLRRFLPSSLQFDRFEIVDADIVMVTKNAEFPMEAVSGGISAMLELSWQIFLRRKNQPSFTVCIDEPENHLHPELQRSIVPSLLAGFPDVTFIVSTHSPFVVTSTEEAFVYALGSDENGGIRSRRVENINKSATPDETLMSVLGLDTTLPIWAEDRLSKLLEALPASPSAAELREFRDELMKLGLDRQFPDAVRSLDTAK